MRKIKFYLGTGFTGAVMKKLWNLKMIQQMRKSKNVMKIGRIIN